jgi:type I restriction enzyme S subunit
MTSRLGDIAEVEMGQSPPGYKYNRENIGIPLLNGPSEFGPHHPKPTQFTADPHRIAKRGDILFCVRGSTTGRMNWADQPYAIGRGIAAIRHKNGPEYQPFLRALLQFALPHLLSQATGSTFPNVSYQQLISLPCHVPTHSVQRAIARILGALDDKIELNRRMNETLEGMARAIFKSWFIDFDPVRAKAEGRDPGLPQPIADLFPSSFQKSELGSIPSGWRVVSIGSVVRCVGGATPSTKNPTFWEDGTVAFATPKDMASLISPVILDTERHITEEGLTRISSGRLPAGTVLLSSRAPIGYLAITDTPLSVNQGIIAMICEGGVGNHYVLNWVSANMEIIRTNAGGTTFAEISKKNFRPIRMLIPGPPVLDEFQQFAERLHKRMIANIREAKSLSVLRDTLLPRLISGKIQTGTANTPSEV